MEIINLWNFGIVCKQLRGISFRLVMTNMQPKKFLKTLHATCLI